MGRQQGMLPSFSVILITNMICCTDPAAIVMATENNALFCRVKEGLARYTVMNNVPYGVVLSTFSPHGRGFSCYRKTPRPYLIFWLRTQTVFPAIVVLSRIAAMMAAAVVYHSQSCMRAGAASASWGMWMKERFSSSYPSRRYLNGQQKAILCAPVS